jgi:tetratricopeptide (TPR) repeat protein
MTSIAAQAKLITDKLEDWTLNGCITKIVKALQIVTFYLGKLIFPYGFIAEYETVFAWSPTTPSVVLTFIGLIALLFFAFRLRTKQPYLLFGICWYLVALIPVLNLFKTTPVVADRYAFLPSFAFFFVIACAALQLSDKITPKIPVAAGILLITWWGTTAAFHNKVWFSEETLWTDAIRVSPNNIRPYRNLGNFYLVRGEYSKAISYFSPIADEDPCYYYVLGYLAYENGDMSAARDYFVKSLGRDVYFIASLFYLGMIYEKTGQIDMAGELFRQALNSREIDSGGFKVHAEEHLKRLDAVSIPSRHHDY